MFRDDPCVVRWVGGLAESTSENRLPLLEDFSAFVGMTPSEMVEWQRKHPLNYMLVDRVYEWNDRYPLRVSTKRSRGSTIRGFFVANRAPMPVDKHRYHSRKEPVWGKLTVDEFRVILASCNIVYRPAFLVQWYIGGGVGELIYVNTHHAGHIRELVKKGKQIITVNFPGRKHSLNVQPFYSFIGPDAVEALKHLFHSQGWKEDEVLFRNEYRKPVTKRNLQDYFRKHAIRTGIIKRKTPKCLDCKGETVRQVERKGNSEKVYYLCTACQVRRHASEFQEFINPHHHGGIRYRMRTHEIRDLFRTEFHRASRYTGVDLDVAKFCMGHGSQIDPNKYDKIMRDIPATLDEYRKALPFLNILSEEPRKIPLTSLHEMREREKQLLEKVEKLEAEATVQREDREKLQQAMERLKKLEKQIRALKG